MSQKMNRLRFIGIMCIFAIISGSNYCYPLLATYIRDKISTNEMGITWLGYAVTLGGMFQLPAGLIYDKYGPLPTCMYGIIFGFIGLFTNYLILNGDITLKYYQLILVNILYGQVGGYLDLSAITTIIKNFPNHRGLAVAAYKSMLGLSASILTEIYNSLLYPNIVHFVLVLAVPMLLIALIIVPFIKIAPSYISDKINDLRLTKGLKFCLINALFIAAWLFCIDIYRASIDHDDINHLTNIGFFIILMGLLLVFLFVSKIYKVQDRSEPIIDNPNVIISPSLNKPLLIGADDQTTSTKSATFKEALYDPLLWYIFINGIIICGGPLLVIANIPMIVESYGGKDCTLYVSIFSIFSSIGRVVSGITLQNFKSKLKRIIWFCILPLFVLLFNILLIISKLGLLLYTICGIAGFTFGSFCYITIYYS